MKCLTLPNPEALGKDFWFRHRKRKIIRVSDDVALDLVHMGLANYCPKWVWKRAKREQS